MNIVRSITVAAAALVAALFVALALPSRAADGASAASYASAAPMREPRLFGEGVISTRDDEFGGQFSADGRTLWFSKSVPRFHIDTIFVSEFRGGQWQEPQIADFSGIWHDYDPTLTPDSKRLYFISDRPSQNAKSHPNYDIWYLDRTPGGWSVPKNAGAPINGAWSSHFAVTTNDGSLYFTSDHPGGKGYLDVWVSRLVDGRYQEPSNLGDTINHAEWANFEVYVAPDESYMVVSAYGHDDSLGDCDLYVSHRRGGVWQPLQNLGPTVNSAARDYSARVSPDGKYLIYTSERGVPTDARTTPWTYAEFTRAIRSVRNGLGDIYQIDLDAALPSRSAR
jgi:Tol biopolymer transport system component